MPWQSMTMRPIGKKRTKKRREVVTQRDVESQILVVFDQTMVQHEGAVPQLQGVGSWATAQWRLHNRRL